MKTRKSLTFTTTAVQKAMLNKCATENLRAADPGNSFRPWNAAFVACETPVEAGKKGE
jgi:hypothetical protein